MELGVNHVQNLSSLITTIVNIFDKYNKKFWYPQDLFQIMTENTVKHISWIA